MRPAVLALVLMAFACREPYVPDTGTRQPGSLSTSTALLDLGALPVGQEATGRVDLRNEGDGPLQIWDIGFSDDAMRVHWLIAGETSAVLDPGGSETLLVTFRPAALGDLGVVLQILSDDPLARVREVTLRGEGLGTPSLRATPDSLDFGVVVLGESAEADVILANHGDGDLSIGEARISAGETEFILILDPSHSVLAPGAESGLAVVRFEPHFDGPLFGTLSIASDDPAIPNLSVPLTGEGDPPSSR